MSNIVFKPLILFLVFVICLLKIGHTFGGSSVDDVIVISETIFFVFILRTLTLSRQLPYSLGVQVTMSVVSDSLGRSHDVKLQ